MQGQWIGNFFGDNKGHITLNLEKIDDQLLGHTILVDHNNRIPSSIAKLKIEKIKDGTYLGQLTGFLPINPETLLPSPWENIKHFFDSTVTIPSTGTINFTLADSRTISGTWRTEISTKGNFTLTKSAADQTSNFPCIKQTWAEFKKFISTLDIRLHIFRGQPTLKRLRTSYHRTGRSDISRYIAHIPELKKRIYTQINHHFNLNNPEEYAALLSLAQHYGYPTPLLDWSRSPYVAAYFAYAGLTKECKNESVRIFVFNSIDWQNNTMRVDHIDSPILSITPIAALPILNNRAQPQQSVTTFTNVDDVETFIQQYETRNNAKYLTIIELPAEEKSKVLNELYIMNINAGLLFPGLDGICRMLKEMHFL